MSAKADLDIRYSPSQERRTPESYVLHACLDYLYYSHIWAVRMNTGKLPVAGHKDEVRFVRFGTKGMADILSMPCLDLHNLGRIVPVPLWIECKAKGNSPSEQQLSFRDWVVSNGHFYLVAYGPDDIALWIENHRRMQ